MSDSPTIRARRPSLVNPDLNGLRSVSKLGEDTTFWQTCLGISAIMICIVLWGATTLFPFFILFLLYIEYYSTAIIIFSVAMLPYLFPISPQPWICRLYARYGPYYFDGGCSMSFEGEPRIRDPNIPMCASVHPHGLMSILLFMTVTRIRGVQDVKSKERKKELIGSIAEYDDFVQRLPLLLVGEGQVVYAPIFNFLVSQTIGLVSASRKSVRKLMRKKQSFWMTPGAFEELAMFKKGENAVYIRERKGFIKYCLQFGYEIAPVYMFGEVETYRNLFYSDNESMNSIKARLSKHKIPSVFPLGPNWFIPFLPFANIGLHGIFSKNTRHQYIENPTQEQIDEVHAWYCDEIAGLFERNKWRFGYDDDTKLKIL